MVSIISIFFFKKKQWLVDKFPCLKFDATHAQKVRQKFEQLCEGVALNFRPSRAGLLLISFPLYVVSLNVTPVLSWNPRHLIVLGKLATHSGDRIPKGNTVKMKM